MENNVKKIKLNNSTIKLVVSAIVLFAGAFSFVPEAGILKTIPLLFVAGIVVGLIGIEILVSASLVAVFNLCLYFVRGSGIAETILFTLVAMLFAVSGMYAVKLVSLAKRTQKANVRKKCILLCAVAVVVSVAVSVLLCGNPVSFFKSDFDNTSHVVWLNEHLGAESVRKEYTSYDFLSGEYRTYVVFNDEENIIGAENDCYISLKKETLTDNVRDYYEDKMLAAAEKTLLNAVVNVTSAFEITASDVVFENDEFLRPGAHYEDYASRIGYVVSFYSILDKEDDFLSLCNDAMKQLENSGIEFKEIVFCGGNASKVLFAAKLLPGMDFNTLSSKWSGNFDGFKHVNLEKEYGVTEEIILDYWNNR